MFHASDHVLRRLRVRAIRTRIPFLLPTYLLGTWLEKESIKIQRLPTNTNKLQDTEKENMVRNGPGEWGQTCEGLGEPCLKLRTRIRACPLMAGPMKMMVCATYSFWEPLDGEGLSFYVSGF